MPQIKEVRALQVLDSRGNPTLKVTVTTDSGEGSALVPSGASTGSLEALELRDGKKEYSGRGVARAVEMINKQIRAKIVGLDAKEQQKVDLALIELDHTAQKEKVGGNTMLGVSLAACRAAALSQRVELFEHIASLYGTTKFHTPVPLANVINGGKHAGNGLKVQEFMLIPNNAQDFSEATRMIVETYHLLQQIILEKCGPASTGVGDEGGFAPRLATPEEALDLMMQAITKAGYRRKVNIGLDVAATELFSNGMYDLGVAFKPSELSAYYSRLIDKYSIKSLEDPFAEKDYDSWQTFFETVGKKKKIQIVGDDLTVTNEGRVKFAIGRSLCNALILKVNQVGTLTEAFAAAKTAQAAGWEIIVSHRSGDTEDAFIADLAVGIGASQIKLGAPCRGERTAKYNRLLEIEQKLGKSFVRGWLRLRI